MEQREHPRIQIPLLVELTHPAVGTIQTTVRDVSKGGVFVYLPNPKVSEGAKIKLRLMAVMPGDTQPTPTVEMRVARTTEQGLGLAFVNKTAEHLWQSAQRLRNELEIGRDYFQVQLHALLTHPDRGVLFVQQNGRWMLPGHYLMVGINAQKSMAEACSDRLGLQIPPKEFTPCQVDATPDISVSEAATFRVALTAEINVTDIQLSADSNYKDWRWVSNVRDLGEITMADEWQRKVAEVVLKDRELN